MVGRIMMIALIGFILMASSCAQETSGEEQEGTSKKEEEALEKELTFEEYVALLKQLEPCMPIEGSHFTSFEGQLPNAPRAYRNGYHEGFDFYDGFCGVKIEEGTPVVAIASGSVVRLDTVYEEIDPREREKLLAEAKELGGTPESTQDKLRGRQVWVDHGNGIVTRYCHLSGVVSDLPRNLAGGLVIGYVGGSGTKSKTPHLHFEVRFGDSFFGKDMAPKEIRKLAVGIFGGEEGSP
jgi:murein DD-endopeptidase MepM/ murein hydrolase activator NlpD